MRLHFCVFVQCPSTGPCVLQDLFLFFPRWTQVERSFRQCQTDCQFVDNFIYSDGTERGTHTSIALAELVGESKVEHPKAHLSLSQFLLCILLVSCLGCWHWMTVTNECIHLRDRDWMTDSLYRLHTRVWQQSIQFVVVVIVVVASPNGKWQMKMEIIQLTWTNVGIKKKQHSWLPGDLEKQWSNVNNFHEKPQITKATTIRQQQQHHSTWLVPYLHLCIICSTSQSTHALLSVSLSLSLCVCDKDSNKNVCCHLRICQLSR